MFDDARFRSLQCALQENNVDALYVRDTANIEWVSGFEGVFDEEQAHALFVPADGDELWLHSDSRYVSALEREASESPITVDAEAVRFSEWAHKMWESYGQADSLGIEQSIALKEFRSLEEAFEGAHPFMETDGLILGLRAVKSEEEACALQRAQDVTDAAFSHICAFIRPGMTEREIQLELDGWMLSHGADALAFPSIVASGPNGANPHALVSDRPVSEGECIVMDFGARKQGYCSDMTRTVFLGEPSSSMRQAFDALRAAHEGAAASIKPGISGKEAHERALSLLDEAGFGGCMGHSLGHGVGIQIHEEPLLSPRNEHPLVVGNVVTVEPGIYLPGRFGMRLEDCGIVEADGFHPFTRSTHEMVIL